MYGNTVILFVLYEYCYNKLIMRCTYALVSAVALPLAS